MSQPLVEVEGLAKTFEVSPPWLNRVAERKPRQFVHAVDDVGFRIARPIRSVRISAPANCQLPASAIAGTASKLMPYPMNVTGQCLPVLSAMYPATARKLYPRNSPAPAMMLMAAAPAPSVPRNGPLMLAPPS